MRLRLAEILCLQEPGCDSRAGKNTAARAATCALAALPGLPQGFDLLLELRTAQLCLLAPPQGLLILACAERQVLGACSIANAMPFPMRWNGITVCRPPSLSRQMMQARLSKWTPHQRQAYFMYREPVSRAHHHQQRGRGRQPAPGWAALQRLSRQGRCSFDSLRRRCAGAGCCGCSDAAVPVPWPCCRHSPRSSLPAHTPSAAFSISSEHY